MKKKLRLLLLPVSWIYGGVAALRRCCVKPVSFAIPTICIGNLRVGGTGKTPHTDYVADILSQNHQVAILRRGYGRKSKGFILAGEGDSAQLTAQWIGDEPLYYFRKFPRVKVAVDEDRCEGVCRLQSRFPHLEAILLDDAYQHVKIRARLNIILTCYNDLYVNDFPLPAGNLREFPKAAQSADVIIVTKAPADLSETTCKEIESQLHLKENQKIFFTTYHYLPLQPMNAMALMGGMAQVDTVLLLTGIAQPEALQSHLSQLFPKVVHIDFPDHHDFSLSEMEKVYRLYLQYAAQGRCMVVTTEKDAMRLNSEALQRVTSQMPVYVQPVLVRFLFHQEDFNKLILSYV